MEEEEEERQNWECTEKCRSLEHGKIVCRIGRKGDVQDVFAMWRLCRNYAGVKDSFGRTALHMAASRGHSQVVKWLLRKERAPLNAKDFISGYTPLHRSIYFGQLHIARNLIQAGSSLSVVDKEGLSALDLCLVERQSHLPVSPHFNLNSDPTELFVWGSNDNFTLGTGSEAGRKSPEPLELFRRRPGETGDTSSVAQVQLQLYHSAFLCQNGDVFVCGVGNSGRLGLGPNVLMALTPQRVPLQECVQVALGLDHTLFLLADGSVRSCGGNENLVLGHGTTPVPTRLFYPRTLESLRSVKVSGVRASRTHSVFFSMNRLFTCGLNQGQLGPLSTSDSHIILPRQVSCVSPSAEPESEAGESDHFFHLVVVNEMATVIRSRKGIIHLLHRGQHRKIQAQHLAVSKLVVLGGEHGIPLTLYLLTYTGSVVIWREDLSPESPGLGLGLRVKGTFTQVVFDVGRSLRVKDMAVGRSSILVISGGGEGWVGRVPPQPLLSVNRNSVEEKAKRPLLLGYTWRETQRRRRKEREGDEKGGYPLEHIKLRRTPIHAGVRAASDPRGNNFAVLQRHQKMDFVELPLPPSSTLSIDLERLLLEAHAEDVIHDVLFNVQVQVEGGTRRRAFPAHRFILAKLCPHLFSLVRKSSNSCSTGSNQLPLRVTIEKVEPLVFEQVLRFIYTGTCEVLQVEARPLIPPHHTPSTFLSAISAFARQLELPLLAKKVGGVEVVDGVVERKKGWEGSLLPAPRPLLGREEHVELSDVTILSSDGVRTCAHACVLVSRMEYFNRMLGGHGHGHGWKESSTREVRLSVGGRTVEVLLDFLYEERTDGLRELEVDVVREVFMASDLFVLDELRTAVEVTLGETIGQKNVGELLRLSLLFNAEQLRKSCANFIALNLAPLLENRLLDAVEEEGMRLVTDYYQRFHPLMRQRQLRSDSTLLPLEEDLVRARGSGRSERETWEEIERCFRNEDDDLLEESEPKSKTKVRKTQALRKRTRTLSGDVSDSTPTPPTPPPRVTSEDSSLRPHQPQPPPSPPVRNKAPVQVLSSFHFPSLSNAKLVPVPEEYNSLPLSLPSPEGRSGGKKKTKWRSLEEKGRPLVREVETKVGVGVGGRDLGNPWQKFKKSVGLMEESSSATASLSQCPPPQFKEIESEEQEMKENLRRVMEKPLRFLQVEEVAMEQLRLRYESPDILEGVETLRIERVCSNKFPTPANWPTPAPKVG